LPASFGASRRALFRVVYPFADRPVIEVGRHVHDVVDVSERGLRYEVHDRHVPEIDALVYGLVKFKGSDEIGVTGSVIRTREGVVVLALEPPGIPFSTVLQEQRYLRSKGFRVLD
jgi:hypothetical protein